MKKKKKITDKILGKKLLQGMNDLLKRDLKAKGLINKKEWQNVEFVVDKKSGNIAFQKEGKILWYPKRKM